MNSYTDDFVCEASLLLQGGTFNVTGRADVTLDFPGGVYLIQSQSITPLLFAPFARLSGSRVLVFGAGQLIIREVTADYVGVGDGSRVNGTIRLRQFFNVGQTASVAVAVGGDVELLDGATALWTLPAIGGLVSVLSVSATVACVWFYFLL